MVKINYKITIVYLKDKTLFTLQNTISIIFFTDIRKHSGISLGMLREKIIQNHI